MIIYRLNREPVVKWRPCLAFWHAIAKLEIPHTLGLLKLNALHNRGFKRINNQMSTWNYMSTQTKNSIPKSPACEPIWNGRRMALVTMEAGTSVFGLVLFFLCCCLAVMHILKKSVFWLKWVRSCSSLFQNAIRQPTNKSSWAVQSWAKSI